MEPEKKYYSISGAAQFLGGVSNYTVEAWLSQGKLRRVKIGRRTMVGEGELLAFISRCNPGDTATAPVETEQKCGGDR
jgi:excisionase family DNA binding protein